MKIVDQELINNLYIAADKSDRKRSHHLLHLSHQDKVQRLLIAMIRESFVEPHYHEQKHQWELFQVLEGTVEMCIYDSALTVTEKYLLGGEGNISMVEIEPNDIHSVRCVSDKALLLEIKEGPFNAHFAKRFI
ncbi:hypothetical protein EQ875_03850 [Photobacterium damselae subsp. damselae]|uniref:WbuC family cupin fold metalloprotein n=1 Tax=Photobacterium damselae TaxID=38293 RepID=UPI00109B77EC|nr:WbuC family cupin fold metalloprotein [Photobacterium damselae]TGZ32615.1 hypothetical protein EQ875_03850 [Photobacterium damselae subsp. damselae]